MRPHAPCGCRTIPTGRFRLLQNSGLLNTLFHEKKASALSPRTILLFALRWFAVIYRAVRLNEREMNAGAFFSDIDWTRLDAIVGAFKDRLRWYYLDAADTLRKNGRQFDHTNCRHWLFVDRHVKPVPFWNPVGSPDAFRGLYC